MFYCLLRLTYLLLFVPSGKRFVVWLTSCWRLNFILVICVLYDWVILLPLAVFAACLLFFPFCSVVRWLCTYIFYIFFYYVLYLVKFSLLMITLINKIFFFKYLSIQWLILVNPGVLVPKMQTVCLYHPQFLRYHSLKF